MASHLSDIGLREGSREAFNAMVERAANAAVAHPCAQGEYLCWSAGGGAELWLQRDPAGALVGFNPHFSGGARLRFGLVELIADAEHPFDGALFGWANPHDSRPSSGDYPLAIDVPDFDALRPRLEPGSIFTLQVAAFAHTLELHADDAAFAASQGEGARLAAEAFIPTGLLGEDRPRRAEALFTGHVLSGGLQTNPATGEAFHALRVRTLGGEYDVVADPAIVSGTVAVGAIAQGTFWLSGRHVESDP